MALKNAPSWQSSLNAEFKQPYMQDLKAFLRTEKDKQKVIYPHASNWFHALETTPLTEVKVVILGQDPYHQRGQAHGLCFSVLPGVKPPPSLLNIYKELQTDLAVLPATHGYLESWAMQGILLLNAVLTVEDSKANSHQGKGWETLTDKIIATVNEHLQHIVFMLWGKSAQKKGIAINQKRHQILSAAHPSPFSAHKGFFGCQHFSKANHYLTQHNKTPIEWQLPRL